MRKRYPIRDAGYMFGNWEVLKYLPVSLSPTNYTSYKVRCVLCGSTGIKQSGQLEYGNTTQCKPCSSKAKGYGSRLGLPKKVAKSLTARYYSIVQRCYNPNAEYYMYYGGRGIRVHESWLIDPVLFLQYLMTLSSYDTLDWQID